MSDFEQKEITSNTNYSHRSTSPLLLSGLLIKEFNYSFGIFYDMFHAFHSHLDKTKVLFVSGYGWGDLGINRRILHWLQYYPNRKLVLMYDETNENVNEFFPFQFARDAKFESKILFIGKYFKDCNINDIKSYI